MKKTKLLLLILALMFVTMGDDCDDDDSNRIPDPGFRIISVRVQGRFETPVSGAQTSGDWKWDNNNARGNVRNFNIFAGNAGQATVDGGRAPAVWFVRAMSGWMECDGKDAYVNLEAGKDNYLGCTLGVLLLPMSPSSINTGAGAASVEFQVGANGLDATFGTPTLRFINEYGTLVAQTPATEVGYSWVKGRSDCLMGLPPGDYTMQIMNATADGVGQMIGTAGVYLYGGLVQNAIDDPTFFVRQQYLGFLHREPDQGGWEFWTNMITQCGSDAACIAQKRVEVSMGFWYSPEFLNAHPGLRNPAGVTPDFNNAEFLRLCYLYYLQRNPDELPDSDWSGYNSKLAQLNSTNDYFGMAREFITSDEYRWRFMPLLLLPPPDREPEPDPVPCSPYRVCLPYEPY